MQYLIENSIRAEKVGRFNNQEVEVRVSQVQFHVVKLEIVRRLHIQTFCTLMLKFTKIRSTCTCRKYTAPLSNNIADNNISLFNSLFIVRHQHVFG